ncbi:MAG: hypothetical protein JWN03_8132 [Nocardia sp.]|nr:hypothetical protein [Nocardia sp.]
MSLTGLTSGDPDLPGPGGLIAGTLVCQYCSLDGKQIGRIEYSDRAIVVRPHDNNSGNAYRGTARLHAKRWDRDRRTLRWRVRIVLPFAHELSRGPVRGHVTKTTLWPDLSP